jgi:hypothetical protein
MGSVTQCSLVLARISLWKSSAVRRSRSLELCSGVLVSSTVHVIEDITGGGGDGDGLCTHKREGKIIDGPELPSSIRQQR